MQRGRRRHPLTAWTWAVCAGVLLVWWTHQTAVPTGVTAVRGVVRQANTSNLPLRITATAAMWNGKPVYRLENLSAQVLSHLQLFSWSNQPLPIVWTGPHLPADFQSNGPVVSPPVALPPGQSAWFELGDVTAQPLTVLWREQFSAVYETLTIPR